MTDFLLAGIAFFVIAFLGLVLPGHVFAGLVILAIVAGVLAFGLVLVWPVVRR